MLRGQVYVTQIELPNRSVVSGPGNKPYAQLDKWLVCLQGGPDFEFSTETAVVIASSLKTTRPARSFEVYVGIPEGMNKASVIDCRWPYTVPTELIDKGSLRCTLDPDVMYKVDKALIRGLQMGPKPT